jgi:hypothetical protein
MYVRQLQEYKYDILKYQKYYAKNIYIYILLPIFYRPTLIKRLLANEELRLGKFLEFEVFPKNFSTLVKGQKCQHLGKKSALA